MRTIPLVTADYPPRAGGVARYYETVVTRWQSAAWRFEARVMDPKRHWLAAVPLMGKLVARQRAVALGELLPWGLALLPFLKFRFCLVIFVHGLDVVRAGERRLPRLAAALLLKRADLVICNSYATADLLRASFPGRTKPVAVNYPQYGGDWGMVAARPLQKFLFLGRLVERKGAADLIAAWPAVRAAFPDAHLTVAGNGPEFEKLKALAGEGVTVHRGPSGDEERDELYAHHQAFVFAPQERKDDFEGFGMVIQEAAAHGLRIFTRLAGGVAEAAFVPAVFPLPQGNEGLADALVAGIRAHQADLAGSARLLDAQQRYVRDRFSDPATGWAAAGELLSRALSSYEK